ncbi:MAG: methyltransferase domain-containing protein [Kiritimatiellae bacterium]|nr:methyltransferase domain-containing protein [Kiritimatiellia bacterium]
MIHFVKQFARYPNKVGAIAASSQRLARLMMKTASNLEGARVVVEFGPGTGVFTEHILRRIPADAVFFALELNPDFAERTRKRCPTATVYNDSATNVCSYLKQHGASHCDCIISGLPWGLFEDDLQDALLDAIEGALRPGGEFLTFAYLGGPLLRAGKRFRETLPTRFRHVATTDMIWQNLPPAFVYYCRK